MAWFGLLHDIEEQHKAVAKGEISASEILDRHKLRAAEARAEMDRFDALVSPHIASSGTTGVWSSAAMGVAGVGSMNRAAGFETDALLKARHLLAKNNIPPEELCSILEVYCRVLNKTRGENNE